MEEKRKYPRHKCKIPVSFEFYEGNPDEIDDQSLVPLKGKGHIIDISKVGAFVVSNSRVNVNMPIILHFTKDKKIFSADGTIIRTGLLKNNPSDIAQQLPKTRAKGDSYIAVKFDIPLIVS